MLTSKCASRHNGVHFFDIWTSKSAPCTTLNSLEEKEHPIALPAWSLLSNDSAEDCPACHCNGLCSLDLPWWAAMMDGSFCVVKFTSQWMIKSRHFSFYWPPEASQYNIYNHSTPCGTCWIQQEQSIPQASGAVRRLPLLGFRFPLDLNKLSMLNSLPLQWPIRFWKVKTTPLSSSWVLAYSITASLRSMMPNRPAFHCCQGHYCCGHALGHGQGIRTRQGTSRGGRGSVIQHGSLARTNIPAT